MGTVFIDSNREVFFLENAIEKKIFIVKWKWIHLKLAKPLVKVKHDVHITFDANMQPIPHTLFFLVIDWNVFEMTKKI